MESHAAVQQKIGLGTKRRSNLDVIPSLIDRFKKSDRCIAVNFRGLANGLQLDRATHLIHSYPAKLLSHIPHIFSSSEVFSKPGDIVLDPFCGSGTVMLEAMLAGRNAIGADANPLARLVSKVKTTIIPRDRLDRECRSMRSRLRTLKEGRIPDVVNLEYWFHPHVIEKLARLKAAIDATTDQDVRDFFLVSFSACVRKVSLADPRVAVPVRLRAERFDEGHWLKDRARKQLSFLRRVDVHVLFFQILEANLERLLRLEENSAEVSASIVSSDARNLSIGKRGGVAAESVQMIITSPPYAGAQKYIRASSLSLGWLEMCPSNDLRKLEDKNIGREHYLKAEHEKYSKSGIASADRVLSKLFEASPVRAHIASKYLQEMKLAFSEMRRVLKPGGFLVLVAANNRICGQEFFTERYLRTVLQDLGFSVQLRLVDDIVSRGLMTSRNKTAGLIMKEFVTVFRKESSNDH